MGEKLRLRATMTVEVEYEVDMDDYGTDDPWKIVQMDQMDFDQDPADLLGRDEAQHRVDVEDITMQTTDQQQPSGPQAAKAHRRHPEFNIKGTRTSRILGQRQ